MTQTITLPVDIELPDYGDEHVLAAAIAGKADVLVTDNLRDFPDEILRRYGIEKTGLDDFLLDMLDLDPTMVMRALSNIAGSSRNPPRDVPTVLSSLARCNAEKFAHTAQTQLWRLPE